MRTRLTPLQQHWKRYLQGGVMIPSTARAVVCPRVPILDVASIELLRSFRYKFKPCVSCSATIMQMPIPPGKALVICVECALELCEEPD